MMMYYNCFELCEILHMLSLDILCTGREGLTTLVTWHNAVGFTYFNNHFWGSFYLLYLILYLSHSLVVCNIWGIKKVTYCFSWAELGMEIQHPIIYLISFIGKYILQWKIFIVRSWNISFNCLPFGRVRAKPPPARITFMGRGPLRSWRRTFSCLKRTSI